MTASSLALKMQNTTPDIKGLEAEKKIRLFAQSTQNDTSSDYTLGPATFKSNTFPLKESASINIYLSFETAKNRHPHYAAIGTRRIQAIESNGSEKLELRWKNYLSDLPQASSGKFNVDFVTLLKKTRDQLHNFLKFRIDPPDVFKGEDGGVQLVWERKNLLLSVDIIKSNNIEWFLKNKETKEYWGFEGISIDNFPPSDLQKILIFQKFNT